ncbi:hypothetical protein BJF79_12365 [Actinomadura sp. CNU-125]|nr:hypothetical protein BJF79_12365 [Actinomadura sp. CNU-125]
MHDPGRVGGVERVPDRRAHRRRLPPRQRPARQPVGEGLPVEQLHHDVRDAAPRTGFAFTGFAVAEIVLAVVVDAGDVRVREPGGGLRLLPQPPGELLRPVVAGHLDGDRAVEDEVVGAPHGGHAAGAERRLDPVALPRQVARAHGLRHAASL